VLGVRLSISHESAAATPRRILFPLFNMHAIVVCLCARLKICLNRAQSQKGNKKLERPGTFGGGLGANQKLVFSLLLLLWHCCQFQGELRVASCSWPTCCCCRL